MYRGYWELSTAYKRLVPATDTCATSLFAGNIGEYWGIRRVYGSERLGLDASGSQVDTH